MTNSTMYKTLESTATNFIHSCRPAQPGTNSVRSDLILSHTTDDFTMTWGHNYFTSTFPPLQTAKSGPEWQEHMRGMAETFSTWTIDVTDTMVDPEKRKVMVRGDFNMTVKGSEGPVGNDIVLVMRMSEDGGKLVGCTEFIDPVASQELGKRMAALKQ